MEWIKYSKYNMPPQGLKILCFRKGNLWVARRFEYKGENYWVEIAYGGEKGAVLTDPPEFWVQVQLLQGYTGYMRVSFEPGKFMTLDQLQETDPEKHEEFISVIIESIKKPLPPQPLE